MVDENSFKNFQIKNSGDDYFWVGEVFSPALYANLFISFSVSKGFSFAHFDFEPYLDTINRMDVFIKRALNYMANHEERDKFLKGSVDASVIAPDIAESVEISFFEPCNWHILFRESMHAMAADDGVIVAFKGDAIVELEWDLKTDNYMTDET